MKTPILILLSVFVCSFSMLGADADELLRRGLFEEEANRDPAKAAASYAEVVAQYDGERKIAATAMFRLAEIRSKAGDKAAATALYQRLLAEFPDSDPIANLSRERLAALGMNVAPALDAAPDLPTDNEDQELARYRRNPNARGSDFNAPLGDPPYKAKSPMIYAASQGWVNLLAYMMSRGAWIDDGLQNGSALTAAAANGRKEAVKLLLDHGGEVNKASEDGWTPLHAACLGHHLDVVSLLLERGADPDAHSSRYDDDLPKILNVWNPELPADLAGWKNLPLGTPLLIAIRQDAVDVMTSLLDHKASLDPKAQPPNGANRSSPLVFALSAGREAAAKLLLARGAETQSRGETALNAAAVGSPDLVPDLLRRGAAKDPDVEGKTPLFNSILAGGQSRAGSDHFSSAAWAARFASYRKAWEALIADGADINARDDKKRTALHYVMPDENHPREVTEWLLAHGADINAQDERKQTPFHFFCNKYFNSPLTPEFKTLISWMIQHGADTDVKDVQGEEPFVVAGRDKLLELNREFHYPQIIPKLTRDRAVTALVSRTGNNGNVELRLAPAGELDAPPTLLTLLRSCFQVEGSSALITLHRANAAGGADEIARLSWDFQTEPPDFSRLPRLEWGDVALVEVNGENNLTDVQKSRWQTAFNWFTQTSSISLVIGDRAAALTLRAPQAYPQFGKVENAPEHGRLPRFRPPGTSSEIEAPVAEWWPGRGPLPWWTVSELVLHLTEAEPRAQLDAIRVERSVEGKTQSFPLDLRAANPEGAESGWDGQPSKVRVIPSRLADGDRLIIPLGPAAEALATRRASISVAVSGRLLGEPIFAQTHNEIGAHTLGELLVQVYLTPMVLADPDFSKIVIHRLKGDSAEEEDLPVDFARTIAEFDFKLSGQDARREDVALRWGDVVEIPVLKSGAEPWKGLDASVRAFLDYALSRAVPTTVNGSPFVGVQAVGKSLQPPLLRPNFDSFGTGKNVDAGSLARMRGAFTALGFLQQMNFDVDNVVRFTLHTGDQTRQYDAAKLQAVNPWIGLGSTVELQQFTP